MKIVCDFCKTEYTVAHDTRGPVRCAVCGHTWNVCVSRANAWILVLSAVCALLATLVFVAAVITRTRMDAMRNQALVPTVTQIVPITGDDGTSQLQVSGTITNNTDDIYGMPDLVITSRDENNHVVGQQKFMPTSTLIDAHGVVSFTYTLSVPSNTVRRINVELNGGD